MAPGTPTLAWVRAYLDHAATTGMLDCARQAMIECLESAPGNPASLHHHGRQARRLLEDARERMADAVAAHPLEVVFTSGGTEANNLAIKGTWWAGEAKPTILLGATEHQAVRVPARWLATGSAEVGTIPVDTSGRPDMAALEQQLARAGGPCLVALMWANNEVGTLSDLPAVQQLCLQFGALLHTDAVAAFPTVAVHAGAADTLAVSGHKFGGPAGVGALIVRRGHSLTPLLHGGGQEGGARSGTPNLPAIVAMSVAAQWVAANRAAQAQRLAALSAQLIAGVRAVAPDAQLSGPENADERLCGTVHFCFPGLRGETILALLDQHGVSASTGAACSAGVNQDSHVLAAMGFDQVRSMGAIRFSLGHASTAADIEAVLAALPAVLDQARRAANASLWRQRGPVPRRVAGSLA